MWNTCKWQKPQNRSDCAIKHAYICKYTHTHIYTYVSWGSNYAKCCCIHTHTHTLSSWNEIRKARFTGFLTSHARHLVAHSDMPAFSTYIYKSTHIYLYTYVYVYKILTYDHKNIYMPIWHLVVVVVAVVICMFVVVLFALCLMNKICQLLCCCCYFCCCCSYSCCWWHLQISSRQLTSMYYTFLHIFHYAKHSFFRSFFIHNLLLYLFMYFKF